MKHLLLSTNTHKSCSVFRVSPVLDLDLVSMCHMPNLSSSSMFPPIMFRVLSCVPLTRSTLLRTPFCVPVCLQCMWKLGRVRSSPPIAAATRTRSRSDPRPSSAPVSPGRSPGRRGPRPRVWTVRFYVRSPSVWFCMVLCQVWFFKCLCQAWFLRLYVR